MFKGATLTLHGNALQVLTFLTINWVFLPALLLQPGLHLQVALQMLRLTMPKQGLVPRMVERMAAEGLRSRLRLCQPLQHLKMSS